MKRLLIILLLLTPSLGFIASGEATLSTINGFDKSGFIFNKGELTGVNGDIYLYEGKLWTNGPNGLLMIKSFGYCPDTGYSKSVKPVIGLFCVKCNDDSYAIINITSINEHSITFNWFHQRDKSNVFIESKASDSSVNYWLILIIIILLFLLLRRYV